MAELPPRHILSKSTFLRGCQCVKSLWLYKNYYKLRDQPTTAQQRVFMQGTDVGLLARQLFGSGSDATPTDVFHYRESVRDTAKYIAEGQTVIFEAAFQYEGILCAVDILIKHKGKWYAYEVKSSTGVKSAFIQDASLQHYVITQSGLALEDFFIVHINANYVRQGDLQLRELFAKQSVKQQAEGFQEFVAGKVNELKSIVSQQFMPSINTGNHCTNPYLCDFYSFCWKEKLKENVVETVKKVVHFDTENNWLQNCATPLYFLDINTYRVAVPGYDGHWPYRHVPFLFSLLKTETIDAAPSQQYFVAEMNTNPCLEFAENLINAIGNEGAIIVVERKFVVERLKDLQKEYLHLAAALEKIISRIVELDNSQKEHYIKTEQEKAKNLYSAEDAAALWYNLRLDIYGFSNENEMKMIKQYHQNRTFDLLQIAIAKVG